MRGRPILPLLAIAVVLLGCTALVIDTSPSAFASNDKTLVMSACAAQPVQGLDVCRVVAGSRISQKWVLVVPNSKEVVAGELRIRYRDSVLTYNLAPKQHTIEIPWRDIVGRDTWRLEDEAPAQVTGAVRFKTKTGEGWTDVLGIAFPIVLKEGYTPMPIDSGNAAWMTTCRVQYSTAGRSAIECKR